MAILKDTLMFSVKEKAWLYIPMYTYMHINIGKLVHKRMHKTV